MAEVFYVGNPKAADLATFIPKTHFQTARLLGLERTPLLARFGNFPVQGYEIVLQGAPRRPRATTLAVAALIGDTTLTLANVGGIMRGDVLMLVSGEYVQATDHANGTANTIAVRRGACGTAAAGQAINTTVKIVGNARYGGEEFQPTYQMTPSTASQYIQTFQFPYKVDGGVQRVRPTYLPAGTSPYDDQRDQKNKDIREDIEYAALYGKPENVGGVVDSWKMSGLFSLIANNNVTAPTNAGAYKPSDMNRDLFEPLIGTPANLLMVSPGWFTGLATWGTNPQQVQAQATIFGTRLITYQVPFFPNVNIILNPVMEGKSAICGVAEEIKWGVLQPIDDVPHGINGDATGGHWIAAMAIWLADQSHFSAVRNITAFAKDA